MNHTIMPFQGQRHSGSTGTVGVKIATVSES